MDKTREKGAIVVEATISLTVFIFLIFTLLHIVNICYVQAKMSVALNSATKDLSQFSYLYFKLGIAGAESSLHQNDSEYLEMSKSTIDGIGTFLNAMSEAENDIDTGDFEAAFGDVVIGTQAGADTIEMLAERIAEDPKQFIIGLARFGLSQTIDTIKAEFAKAVGKAFMKKNLKAYKDDDPDRFLKKAGVVDGLDGLNFDGTVIFAGQDQDVIQLVVTYEVQVIKLLGIDFKFKFTQMSRSKAWRTGVSLNRQTYYCAPREDRFALDSPGWTGNHSYEHLPPYLLPCKPDYAGGGAA